MAIIIGGILGLLALYLWLIGNWFGAIVAFFPIAAVGSFFVDPYVAKYGLLVWFATLAASAVVAAAPAWVHNANAEIAAARSAARLYLAD